MTTLLYIALTLICLLGLPFIIQKFIFIATSLAGITIGSILSGFLLMALLTYIPTLFIQSNTPVIQVIFMTIGLTVNYLFDRKNLQKMDKVYLEGSIIGYIVFVVAYYFKVSPSIWY